MFNQGNKRMIGFTPTDEYFAKGCFGVHGLYQIPELTETKENSFLNDLFEFARHNMASEMDSYLEKKAKYDSAMLDGHKIINTISDALSATLAADAIKKIAFELTAKEELQQLFSNKVKNIGLKWNKEEKKYE